VDGAFVIFIVVQSKINIFENTSKPFVACVGIIIRMLPRPEASQNDAAAIGTQATEPSMGSLSLEDNDILSSLEESSIDEKSSSSAMMGEEESENSGGSGIDDNGDRITYGGNSSSSKRSKSSLSLDSSQSNMSKATPRFDLSFLPKDIETMSDINISAGDQPGGAENGSIFLQGIRKQDRRLLLAEHDCYVRKAKTDDAVKKQIEQEASAFLEEVKITASLSGLPAHKMGSSAGMDSESSKAAVLARVVQGIGQEMGATSEGLEDEEDESGRNATSDFTSTLTTSSKKRSRTLFQLNEPFVLRTSIYEKYIALSKNLFNEHDVVGTLCLLYYPNHYQDVKQVNRVWAAIPHPLLPNRTMPYLVSHVELMGMNSFSDFLQGLFTTYPDCITCYYSHATVKTELGMKIIVKLRFTGTLVKPPQQPQIEDGSTPAAAPQVASTTSNQQSDQVRNQGQGPATGQSQQQQAPPPEILDISGYTTIFFDRNNKVYEVWNDSVVPLHHLNP
jgi:hypothetical protein